MQVFPVPGYAFYGAENGNFFIVGVGGNNNNGNASGSLSITADGVNLVAPGACPANNGGANPCYIDSATALPASATPYTVTLSYPGTELHARLDDRPSLDLPDDELDLADRLPLVHLVRR